MVRKELRLTDVLVEEYANEAKRLSIVRDKNITTSALMVEVLNSRVFLDKKKQTK